MFPHVLPANLLEAASAALSAPLPSNSSSRTTRPLAQKAPRRKLKQVPSLVAVVVMEDVISDIEIIWGFP